MEKQVKIKYASFGDVPHQLRPFGNAYKLCDTYVEVSYDQPVFQSYMDSAIIEVGFDVVKSAIKAYFKSLILKWQANYSNKPFHK